MESLYYNVHVATILVLEISSETHQLLHNLTVCPSFSADTHVAREEFLWASQVPVHLQRDLMPEKLISPALTSWPTRGSWRGCVQSLSEDPRSTPSLRSCLRAGPDERRLCHEACGREGLTPRQPVANWTSVNQRRKVQWDRRESEREYIAHNTIFTLPCTIISKNRSTLKTSPAHFWICIYCKEC